MVERLAPGAGRLERDLELLLDAVLADEVSERARPQRALELGVLRQQFGGDDAPAAFFNASRTCSSGARAGSTSASARSASGTL